MSLVATTIVWAARIEPTPLKLTALALADWSNDEGGSLHPSMEAIAHKVCVSRSQAQRLVHRLMDKGLLSVVEKGHGGLRALAPRYQLHLDRFAALAQSQADGDGHGNANTETGSTGATGSVDATGSVHAAPADDPAGTAPAPAPAKEEPRPAPRPARVATAKASRPAATAAPADGRGSRLPADWTPTDEQLAFCRQHRPDLKPQEVADRFRDYWLGQPGAKGRKSDWLATWRNWVRNERRDTRGGFAPVAPVANLLDTSEVFSEPLRRSR